MDYEMTKYIQQYFNIKFFLDEGKSFIYIAINIQNLSTYILTNIETEGLFDCLFVCSNFIL